MATLQALEADGDVTAPVVCSPRSLDRTFLQRYTSEVHSLAAPKLRREFSLRTLALPISFPLALAHALWMISRLRPDAVFATGGYVSVPVCLAAQIRKIPIVLFDADAVPGRSTQILHRLAHSVCRGMGEAKSEKEVLTGVPVRREILAGKRDAGRSLTGFSGRRATLLILGGSQGSLGINRAVTPLLSTLVQTCDIIHLTGEGRASGLLKHARYWHVPFVLEELPHLLALADVVVSRAGSSALAELSLLGKASILIPLPSAAQDHQRRNADAYAQAGAAVVLEQSSLSTTLLQTILRLLESQEERHHLGQNMRKLARPRAAKEVAGVLRRVVAEHSSPTQAPHLKSP